MDISRLRLEIAVITMKLRTFKMETEAKTVRHMDGMQTTMKLTGPKTATSSLNFTF